MKFRDISLAVIIVIVFVFLYFMSVLLIGIKKIKNNWPEYKCNPMVMPFASAFDHDPVTNFVGCVSGMQEGNNGIFPSTIKICKFFIRKVRRYFDECLTRGKIFNEFYKKKVRYNNR